MVLWFLFSLWIYLLTEKFSISSAFQVDLKAIQENNCKESDVPLRITCLTETLHPSLVENHKEVETDSLSL